MQTNSKAKKQYMKMKQFEFINSSFDWFEYVVSIFIADWKIIEIHIRIIRRFLSWNS